MHQTENYKKGKNKTVLTSTIDGTAFFNKDLIFVKYINYLLHHLPKMSQNLIFMCVPLVSFYENTLIRIIWL